MVSLVSLDIPEQADIQGQVGFLGWASLVIVGLGCLGTQASVDTADPETLGTVGSADIPGYPDILEPAGSADIRETSDPLE